MSQRWPAGTVRRRPGSCARRRSSCMPVRWCRRTSRRCLTRWPCGSTWACPSQCHCSPPRPGELYLPAGADVVEADGKTVRNRCGRRSVTLRSRSSKLDRRRLYPRQQEALPSTYTPPRRRPAVPSSRNRSETRSALPSPYRWPRRVADRLRGRSNPCVAEPMEADHRCARTHPRARRGRS